ncbi:MAG: hypothetical protein HZA08_04510 [Nitrospirae bacterium]|nr:hypothetical protein [Nitrospirota bacterium]
MRSTQRWPEDEMHKCIGYFMADPYILSLPKSLHLDMLPPLRFFNL